MKKVKIYSAPTKSVIVLLLAIVSILVISGCTNMQQQTSSNSNGAVLQLGKEAPEATFTTLEGEELKLSDYRGEKVMLWFFATWCPSCIKAAEVLGNNDKLNGMTVIALKTYGNAGYPGESIGQFAQKYAPNTLNHDNWVWGDASQQATSTYNSQNYPDIYFLIDENGILQDVDGAPAATLNKIVNFASGEGP